MYASNEDEYNREDSDWVFLRQTPPINTVKDFQIPYFVVFYSFILKILHGAVNLVDDEQSNSSSSSSSSSSKSVRTDSVSSLSSTE
jgi:hypothetical protein